MKKPKWLLLLNVPFNHTDDVAIGFCQTNVCPLSQPRAGEKKSCAGLPPRRCSAPISSSVTVRPRNPLTNCSIRRGVMFVLQRMYAKAANRKKIRKLSTTSKGDERFRSPERI